MQLPMLPGTSQIRVPSTAPMNRERLGLTPQCRVGSVVMLAVPAAGRESVARRGARSTAKDEVRLLGGEDAGPPGAGEVRSGRSTPAAAAIPADAARTTASATPAVRRRCRRVYARHRGRTTLRAGTAVGVPARSAA